MTIQTLINHTNFRIEKWYKTVKEDYDVLGNGKSKIEGNTFFIDYIENGVSKVWQTPFYPEYLEFGKNFFFNCWAEEAR